MPQPGMPSASGEDWMVRRLQDLERQVQQLAAANVFGLTGIKPRDGGTDFDGYVNVNGAMSVTGTANFTGNTTIGGTATVAGDITKSNSWGTSSLGPVVFGTQGSPGLSFTKTGTTYGLPCGIGLTRNGANTLDQVTANGPHASNPAFLALRSNQTFTIACDNVAGAAAGPYIQTSGGPNGTLSLVAGGTNGSVSLFSAGTGNVQVNGNFAVTGSKAFLMDHPLRPDTMKLMHAATESDRNGVEYWGTVTTGADGTVLVNLPSYFEALTKTTGRNIQLTPIWRTNVQVYADRIVGGAFTIHGAPGQEVDWLVKAERQRVVDGYDELSFPAEQDKPLIGPHLPEAAS